MADLDLLRKSLPLFKGQAPWQGIPFNIKAGHKVWTVCTDGSYFMAIHGKEPKLKTLEKKEVIKLLEAGAVKPAFGVETEKLRAWAGTVPEYWIFPAPGGVDEDHFGALFEVCVDRRRLACMLKVISFGMIQVWDATQTMGVAGIGLEAKGWRGYLAGLKNGPESDTPKFEFRKSGPATGVDLIDELPQE